MFQRTIDNDISLSLVQESFAPLYVDLVRRQQAYLSQWLAWPKFCQSEQDFRLFIQKSLHDYADGKSMTCAIFYRGQLVGNCSFNKILHDLRKVEVGYWLSEDVQGKGIMQKVVNQLIQIAFDDLDMTKLEIRAATGNTKSRRVAEKCELKLEGVITQSESLNGEIVDHAVYGITR
ncbi:GNAT family N-acetyltransferase [Vibrio mexicanus]|uniref:GNAT family N-acetyltransferase n=1 Tax=Vibrio mexicanus TaxID=1004326 RepID=UPI00063C23AC|nr:GNAT family protein [Vibrio mexicanus]